MLAKIHSRHKSIQRKCRRVFEERGKPECSEKNLLVQNRAENQQTQLT